MEDEGDKDGGAGKIAMLIVGVLVGLGALGCIASVVLIGALTALGNNLEATFNEVADEVSEAPE